MSSLSKLNKLPPLRDQVYESIHRAILVGEIAVGERITEGKLSTFLGVSRTPVREAMSMLQQVGVLRAREGGGYEIFLPTVNEVRESYEVRALLEPVGIQSVAKLCSADYLAELRAIMDAEWEAHKANDPGEFALKNFAFRVKLYENCSNSMIRKVLEQFFQYLNYIAMITLQEPQVRKIVLEGQESIYAALEKRDPALAKKAIKIYLKSAHTALANAAKNNDSSGSKK